MTGIAGDETVVEHVDLGQDIAVDQGSYSGRRDIDPSVVPQALVGPGSQLRRRQSRHQFG